MPENEEGFCIMADKAPALIWAAGPDRLRIHFNKRWLDFTGRPGLAVEKALKFIAAFRRQACELLFRFDAFRGCRNA